jgi:hypothetical protein
LILIWVKSEGRALRRAPTFITGGFVLLSPVGLGFGTSAEVPTREGQETSDEQR